MTPGSTQATAGAATHSSTMPAKTSARTRLTQIIIASYDPMFDSQGSVTRVTPCRVRCRVPRWVGGMGMSGRKVTRRRQHARCSCRRFSLGGSGCWPQPLLPQICFAAVSAAVWAGHSDRDAPRSSPSPMRPCYAACASALYSSSDRVGSSTQSV